VDRLELDDSGVGLWIGRRGELDRRAEKGLSGLESPSAVGKGNASMASDARASGVGSSRERGGVAKVALAGDASSTGSRCLCGWGLGGGFCFAMSDPEEESDSPDEEESETWPSNCGIGLEA